MDTMQLALVVIAVVLLILYLGRRRARLEKED